MPGPAGVRGGVGSAGAVAANAAHHTAPLDINICTGSPEPHLGPGSVFLSRRSPKQINKQTLKDGVIRNRPETDSEKFSS